MARKPHASTSGPHSSAASEELIRQFFRALEQAWGRQHWWPAQSRFEVIVGAYLTQNTAWTNVERAMSNLRRAGVLSLAGIRSTPLAQLEQLVRPAGYFRQKAQRLKTFIHYLDSNYAGSLPRMFARPISELRPELLALNGVGPETADSILLYAGDHDIFVVDAYTRRMVERHRILPSTADYDEIRQLFEHALDGVHPERVAPASRPAVLAASTPAAQARAGGPRDSRPPTPASQKQACRGPRPGGQRYQLGDNISQIEYRGAAHPPSRRSAGSRSERAQVFNQMHALIVGVGKNFCSAKNPDCARCPLRNFLSN